MGREVEGRSGRKGGIRYETKRQTRIQILARHEEPIISALQQQPPPSLRLGDAHTHDRAITKYTGALLHLDFQHFTSPLTPHSRTMLRILRTAPASARLVPLPLPQSPSSLSLSTSPSLQSLCYRGRLHWDSDSYGPKPKYLRTRLEPRHA
jgi:hypothetical protein